MEIHFEKETSDNRKAVENLQVFAEQQTYIES
ncbi:spermidine acetyltransferase, partial [Enterococcus faecalis]